jgi:hypothetical protein
MASKSLGTLTLDMVLKTGGFVSGLDKAARESEKRLKKIKDAAGTIGKAIGVGLAGAAAGLTALTKNAIDTADEVSKLAQKTGVSTEAISELQYAAGLSGVDDLGASLVKFNRSIAEAAQGAKTQADAFKALGVNIKNADGSLKTTEQLLGETADAFAQFNDGANKSAVAMDLFGKTGADLIPFLNEGKKGLAEMRAEAAALGLTIDEKTGKAAEQFNDNLDRLQAVSTGLGTRLATDLAPQLAKVTEYLVGVAKEGDAVGSALEGLRAGVGVIVVPLTGLWNVLQTIVQAFVAVGAAAGALARRDFAALEEIGNAFGEDRKRNIDDVTKAYGLFFGELEKGAATVEKAGELGKKDLSLPGVADSDSAEKLKKTQEAIAEYIKGLEEEVATHDASRAQLEARKAALLGATEAQREQVYQLGAYLELLDQRTQAEKDAAAVFAATRTEAEKYAEELERLNDLRSRGLIDDDTFGRASRTLEEEEGQKYLKLEEEKTRILEEQEAARLRIKQEGLYAGLDALGYAQETALALGKKGFEAFKAFAIAQTIIDTYKAAQSIFASLAAIPGVGPFLAPAGAAAAVGAGLARVASIRAAEPGGYMEGGFTGYGPLDEPAGIVHRQEGVVSASALSAAANAINDPNFWGNGGGSQIKIINNAPGITITPRGNTLTVDMIPQLLEMVDSDQERRTTTGLGRNFRATASKLGAQPSANR